VGSGVGRACSFMETLEKCTFVKLETLFYRRIRKENGHTIALCTKPTSLLRHICVFYNRKINSEKGSLKSRGGTRIEKQLPPITSL